MFDVFDEVIIIKTLSILAGHFNRMSEFSGN